jgi:tungstate transport system ATP-binding protein
MPKNEFLYEISGINHSYGEFTLSIPELKIERGSAVGLSGPNGSGKSTLIRLMSFLEKPASGSILFNSAGSSRLQASMLQQDPYLLKRTVYENVSYGLRIRKDYSDIKKRSAEALERVNLNHKDFMHRKWFELSGGEAKRVALASRLILKPEALLLDEPAANVDMESSQAIIEAVKWMREEHSTTLIISSHDLTWLNSVTDHIWKLYRGKLAGSGSANLIPGPWIEAGKEGKRGAKNSLWHTTLPGGEKIYSSEPPDINAPAVLYPHDIIISEQKINSISAVNRIEAKIRLLVAEGGSGKIRVEAEVSGRILSCYITESSAKKINIIPGKKVFLIFKATSLVWD